MILYVLYPPYVCIYEVYYSYELMVTSRKCFSPNSQGIFKRVKFIILEKMLTTRRYETGIWWVNNNNNGVYTLQSESDHQAKRTEFVRYSYIISFVVFFSSSEIIMIIWCGENGVNIFFEEFERVYKIYDD